MFLVSEMLLMIKHIFSIYLRILMRIVLQKSIINKVRLSEITLRVFVCSFKAVNLKSHPETDYLEKEINKSGLCRRARVGKT